MDPLFNGTYPDDVLAYLGEDAPLIYAGDIKAI
jgi:hypothetical protein